jgi:hypothetical protein
MPNGAPDSLAGDAGMVAADGGSIRRRSPKDQMFKRRRLR